MASTTFPNKRFCAKKQEVRRALGVSAQEINSHLRAISTGKGELRDMQSDDGVLVYKTNSGGWWVARSSSPEALALFIESVNTMRKYKDILI